MTYDHHSNISFFSFLYKKIPDLRLRNHIQHGTDLICQKKAGSIKQRTCHSKTLQLSTGKFPWISFQPVLLYSQSLHDCFSVHTRFLKYFLHFPSRNPLLFPGIELLYQLTTFFSRKIFSFLNKKTRLRKSSLK